MLPAVIQQFGIQATEFLSGIDEMIAGVDRLAASIDTVLAGAERMSAGFTASADRLSAAAGETADAAKAAADGQTVLSEAEKAAADMAAFEAGLLADLAASQKLLADSTRVAASAISAEGRAMKVAADSEAMAGDAAVIAGDKTAVAGDKAEAAGAKAAGFGAAWKTALLGVGIAAVYGIDKAAKFQSSMEQLHTQAGVAQGKIAGLSQQVLQLSGKVGYGPESLSESLYHVASNMASTGASGAQMMGALQVAAEGAQVGNANLEDVTNALGAAIASGIPGVQNYTSAMGMMNATVGAGDMRMQDLADAFGTGVLANIKMYGVTLRDVSAALAVYGDNNIRGAKAGTDLRMAVQSLSVQGPSAAATLAQLGLGTKSLGDALRNGGLNGALELLVSRMKAAGVTAKEQGQVITDLFGKKAGSGIGVLVGEFDRFQGKYQAVAKGAGEFAGDWNARTKTMSQQWADLVAGAQALAVSFGTVLLPAATRVVGALSKFAGMLEQHPALAAFAGALLAVAVAFKVVAAAEAVFDAVTDANPVMLVVMAVIALAAGLYELYEHSKLVRDIVADVARWFRAEWPVALRAAGAVVRWFESVWRDVMHGVDAVIKWFVNGPLAFIKQELGVFRQFWAQHGAQVVQEARAAWNFVRDVIVTAWKVIWDGFLRPGLVILEAAWKLAWGIVVDTVRVVWNTAAAIIRTAIKLVLDIIGLGLDLLTGKWGRAWHDLTGLVSDAIRGVESILGAFTTGALRLLWDAGVNIVKGLINGIKSMFGSIGGVIGDLGHGLVSGFKDVLSIFSPSQVFYQLGTMVTKGLALGISETSGQVKAEAAKLAAAVQQAYGAGEITSSEAWSLQSRISTGLASRLLALQKQQDARDYSALGASITAKIGAGITETMPQALAAAKKLTAAIASELAKGQISSSQAQQLVQKVQADLHSRQDRIIKTVREIGLKMAAGLTQSLEDSSSASAAKSAVAKLIGYVQQAWSAGVLSLPQATAMTKTLEADSARLQSLAAQRQAVAKTIAAAGAYAKSTTSNAAQWGGLSSVAGSVSSGGAIYSGNLLAGMQANLGTIRAFETALKRLAKLGLRKDLISQIIQMGPQQGLQVAEALIQGPGSVIGQMNATQHQLAVATGALGQTAANVTFDTGKAAGKGFLSGLRAQEGELTKMMDRLAKTMVTSMKRELGGGSAGHGTAPNITVHVSGFIGSEQQLVEEIRQAMQQETLRYAKRNGLNNGLSLPF